MSDQQAPQATITLPPDAHELLTRVASDNGVDPGALAGALLLTALTNQPDVDSAVDAVRGDNLTSAADMQRAGY